MNNLYGMAAVGMLCHAERGNEEVSFKSCFHEFVTEASIPFLKMKLFISCRRIYLRVNRKNELKIVLSPVQLVAILSTASVSKGEIISNRI